MGIKLIDTQKRKYRVAFWYRRRHYVKTICGDRRLAEDVEAQMRLQLAEGSYFPERQKKNLTFSEAADRFIKEFVPSGKTKGARKHYTILAQQAKEFLGSMRLAEITPEDVRRYRLHLKAKGYHPVSVNHRHKGVRRIFSWAKNAGHFKGDNPASSTKVKLENERKYWRDRFLSQEEFKRLISVAEPKLKPIILCAVFTGMRRGELVRMKKADINLDNCVIRIPDSKNDEPGLARIPETLFPILEALIKSLSNPESLVFDFKNFDKMWRRAKRRAGLENFHFHDLRHTFASHVLMGSGGNLAAVQELLRLKTPALVNRYAHLAHLYLLSTVNVLTGRLPLPQGATELDVRQDNQAQLDAQDPQNTQEPITNPITPLVGATQKPSETL